MSRLRKPPMIDITRKEPRLWGVPIAKWPVEELKGLPWHAAMFEREPQKVWAAIQRRCYPSHTSSLVRRQYDITGTSVFGVTGSEGDSRTS